MSPRKKRESDGYTFANRPLHGLGSGFVPQAEADRRRELAKKDWTKTKPDKLGLWLTLAAVSFVSAVLLQIFSLDPGRPAKEEGLWFSKPFEIWETILFILLIAGGLFFLCKAVWQSGVKPNWRYDLLSWVAMTIMLVAVSYGITVIATSAVRPPDEYWVLSQLSNETQEGWNYVDQSRRGYKILLGADWSSMVVSNSGDLGSVSLVPTGNYLWKVELRKLPE